jgi:hypothetical protein
MRRAIEIVGTGVVMELSLTLTPKIKKHFIYLEETLDGSYRLSFNEAVIPDFSKVTGFRFSNVLKGKKLYKASVTVEGLDIVMPLTKASIVPGALKGIFFEQLRDGTWMMLYSEALIPDLSRVSEFKVIRED